MPLKPEDIKIRDRQIREYLLTHRDMKGAKAAASRRFGVCASHISTICRGIFDHRLNSDDEFRKTILRKSKTGRPKSKLAVEYNLTEYRLLEFLEDIAASSIKLHPALLVMYVGSNSTRCDRSIET